MIFNCLHQISAFFTAHFSLFFLSVVNPKTWKKNLRVLKKATHEGMISWRYFALCWAEFYSLMR